jgi:hypothetical protein
MTWSGHLLPSAGVGAGRKWANTPASVGQPQGADAPADEQVPM